MSLVCRKASRSGLGGLDDVLEPVDGIGAIADELDVLDPGLAALGDFEDEIDAVVRQLDDLGLDAHVETAAAAVDLDDARRVGLHDRTRERARVPWTGFRLLSCSSLTFLLPSNAMRLMTGFSTTVMINRPPCMVGRRPGTGRSQTAPLRLRRFGRRPAGRPVPAGNRSGWCRPRPAGCLGRRWS